MAWRAAAASADQVMRDWVFLALAGLGISIAPYEYFGGLFLACACASLVARRRNDPRKFVAVIGTAALFATVAAIYGAGMDNPMWPPQIVMLIAGGASGVLLNLIIKLMVRVEDRSTEIADRLIDSKLPKGDDK